MTEVHKFTIISRLEGTSAYKHPPKNLPHNEKFHRSGALEYKAQVLTYENMICCIIYGKWIVHEVFPAL